MLTLISYSDEVGSKNAEKVLESILKRKAYKHRKIENFISSSEARGWEIVYHEIDKGQNKEGFSVFVFKKGINIVVVPRGTDSGLFAENWKYLFYKEHPQAKYMQDFVDKTLAPYLLSEKSTSKNIKIYFCGHSLGGYLALYGSGVLLSNVDFLKYFVKIVTFNGLGLGHSTKRGIFLCLKNLEPWKIVNYRISGDLVSLIGEHFTAPFNFKLSKPFFTNKIDKWKFFVKYNVFAHKLFRFFLFLKNNTLVPQALLKSSNNTKGERNDESVTSGIEYQDILKTYENLTPFTASIFIPQKSKIA